MRWLFGKQVATVGCIAYFTTLFLADCKKIFGKVDATTMNNCSNCKRNEVKDKDKETRELGEQVNYLFILTYQI